VDAISLGDIAVLCCAVLCCAVSDKGEGKL